LQGKEAFDAEKIFRMCHTKKVYFFQADSKDIADK
jgi:hypothetical protein